MESAETQSHVSIYTTPACHFCHMAKDFLKEKNISYTEYNVSEDQNKRAEMIDMTGQMGVPVIKIGDDIIIGFNEEKILELLNR
ncbi:hypothetical protein A2997_02265 [Candidatus Nomurabacteria bacterium RIFCSPLOWO2_01_FULL_36_10b]|uniref:GST N-terminal domain-containing protein n=1 Tax=Candidatus Nomurabacteria bacterium RIFCSPLOWO2_01_FULL_36_10b TaxID=1801766 RepID=A0A1F6WNA5_9BACT|nr:MAG: hypothetical protein A2997_02265 [Candidatus Nomurabacteria bacterium RIFCSPLOWO2_01_FULL_36_10b]